MITSEKTLKRMQIILVEPQEAGNIGAVCRAMKTMGITRLCITGDSTYDPQRIKTMAVHAYDLYESCRRVKNLEDALAGGIFSAGATRRRGKFRKYFSFLPEQFAGHVNTLGDGLVSVVFGREASGLTEEELNLCDAALLIPSSQEFPSLNLAQAVQVVTYVLRRELTQAKGYDPIEREQLDDLVTVMMDSFDQIGFFKLDEREEVHRFYRDILARSGLSVRESQRLAKMFRKIPNLSRSSGPARSSRL